MVEVGPFKEECVNRYIAYDPTGELFQDGDEDLFDYSCTGRDEEIERRQAHIRGLDIVFLPLVQSLAEIWKCDWNEVQRRILAGLHHGTLRRCRDYVICTQYCHPSGVYEHWFEALVPEDFKDWNLLADDPTEWIAFSCMETRPPIPERFKEWKNERDCQRREALARRQQERRKREEAKLRKQAREALAAQRGSH